MPITRLPSWGVFFICCCAGVHGQGVAPLADRVNSPLLPAGISELPISINGKLAYFFKAEDGSDVVHVIGGFELTLGEQDGQRLRSHEAVMWMTQQQYDGRRYHFLELLLWRDAEVVEVGSTITSGPALFVTLSSAGSVTTHVDDLAFESSSQSLLYREGDSIRKSVGGAKKRRPGEDVSLRVFDASGLGADEQSAAVKPTIFFRSEGNIEGPITVGDQEVITVIGGVYLSRGEPGLGDYLEIKADSVVVFMPPAREPSQDDTHGARSPSSTSTLMMAGLGDVDVEAVYLEGDVVMLQGPNMIRASRLYYDFLHDKALILDAVVRAMIVERNIPLYVRAAAIRQLSVNRFSADQAIITTSEFHTPHYHIEADHVEVTNRTPPNLPGKPSQMRAGSFRIRNATLNLAGTPIAYWPLIRGNIETSETSIKSVRTGFSDEFGVELESNWHLFNVLGLKTPEGFDATIDLDYFTERGPALGVRADYRRDRYFGMVKSYLLFDNDKDFLGRERDELSQKDVRGRFLLRHRQYLDDDWQLSLEGSYISDESFLEEFFESEFDNDKEQETLLYLKKQRENWAVTALWQTRILDFTTQTERFPDLGFFLVGEPVGSQATWFSENRAGYVRYRPADQSFRTLLRDGREEGSGAVARLDSRQEIGSPIDLGPVRVVPFAAVRGTIWDDSPEDGGVTRTYAIYGARGSFYLSRIDPDVKSTMFDLDGLRHIIKTDVTAWLAHTNRHADELFPFDQTVEQIDEVDGVAIGVRQRFQTKRGGGDTRRIVDFLTLDVEAGFFGDTNRKAITNGFTSYSRPENSISRNYINSSIIWRINDRTALLSEMNYDINDGEVDILNVSFAVERSPRLSYLLGYRFIEESNSNLLGFDMEYRFTEKHTLAVRERFDVARGQTLDFTVALIRKFPRWFGAISFALDEPEDDFGVSLSLWPEGLPGAGVGSRRFTGLGTGSRLRYE